MQHFYIFLLGLVIGSFVNVVIYRIPLGLSIVRGRSHCPGCDNKLAWFDLLPLFSFLVLSGRCRNCRSSISWTYPLVELCSGFIFLFSYRFFSSSGLAEWLFAIFILETLLILGLIDLRHLILPDSLIITLLIGAVLFWLIEKLNLDEISWQLFAWQNFVGAVILAGFLWLVWLISKGRGLGLGDVKLTGALVLIFGFWGGLVILYAAIIAGVVVGLFLLLAHRANLKTRLPLGTLICLSTVGYIFYSEVILNKLNSVFYSVPYILR